jgi:predicted GH43/DUF377 family glycosyl hydrolase
MVSCRRLGVVLAPDGSMLEAEGVLNPGAVRDRDGRLLLFPRMVAPGNVSRIGIVRIASDGSAERAGIALAPSVVYEYRDAPGGHGCEDARVTYLAELDRYVMAYTAFGPRGARIALAVSPDAVRWERLGLVTFPSDELNAVDNKDAAFFPDVVTAPSGTPCLAFFHRPMRGETINGQTPIPLILGLPPDQREAACIAYVPLERARRDVRALGAPAESVRVLDVDPRWGRLKNGAGTPPVRTPYGWLSMFHGVDAVEGPAGPALFYSAGVMINDIEQPHRIVYRSPEPVLVPETRAERFGTVNDVVFPTGIDPAGAGEFDIYYGAADAKIARARLTVEAAPA